VGTSHEIPISEVTGPALPLPRSSPRCRARIGGAGSRRSVSPGCATVSPPPTPTTGVSTRRSAAPRRGNLECC